MSPTVFAYIGLFTLLLAGAAAAVEWGTQGRGTARHFWTAAIVLAVLAPSGALGLHAFRQQTATPGAAVAQPDVLATIIVSSGRSVVHRGYGFIGRDALIRLLAPSRRAVRAMLVRIAHDFAMIAVVAWMALSISLLAWLVVGVLYWRRAQQSWRRTTLDGVSIDVSTVTGPAVVGFLSHRIVLPSWATTMQPEHRRLVLAHECEHISARDPERLMLAIAALILMPWNVGLWWCAARLRRAIELDCDMRVLKRYPSAKDYGHVLLEVAARGRNSGPLAVPMVALLRLPSELELRLRAMTRARAVGMRGVIGGGLAAIVAMTAAFTTPVPSLPAHYGGTTAARQASPVTTVRAPLLLTVTDTDTKHRADSLAILKAENDSLRAVDRALLAQMRAMSGTQFRIDEIRARLQDLRRMETVSSEGRIGERPPVAANNAIYFGFQVERPAHMLPTTITPIYPAGLRRAGIGGEVNAEFVVDTLGHVDPMMMKITSATNPEFELSVRNALPKMRFAPAVIGGHKVKQLVQQPFTFAITKDPE